LKYNRSKLTSKFTSSVKDKAEYFKRDSFFKYKISDIELSNKLDEIPVSIDNPLYYVDYIYEKFPHLSKIDIINTINTLLSLLRDLYVFGYVLTLPKLFTHFKSIFALVSTYEDPVPKLDILSDIKDAHGRDIV